MGWVRGRIRNETGPDVALAAALGKQSTVVVRVEAADGGLYLANSYAGGETSVTRSNLLLDWAKAELLAVLES